MEHFVRYSSMDIRFGRSKLMVKTALKGLYQLLQYVYMSIYFILSKIQEVQSHK